MSFTTGTITNTVNAVAAQVRQAIAASQNVNDAGQSYDGAPLTEDQIAARDLGDGVFALLTRNERGGKHLQVSASGHVESSHMNVSLYTRWVDAGDAVEPAPSVGTTEAR